MKVLVLLVLCLLFCGCADRPNINDGEKEMETAWEEPSEQFLDDLRDLFRWLNGPDSVFCYTAPLIRETDYVPASELAYNRSAPQETRFISYHQRVPVFLTLPGEEGEDLYAHPCPNAVYLTEANGKRTKICPFADCRAAADEECLHLEIDENSVVCGDAVYFLWINRCMLSPDNPRRAEDFLDVYMLLRYDLTMHTVEKVLDIENHAEILGTAFGLVYIQVREPGTNSSYMLLLDHANTRASKVSLTDSHEFSGHIYLEKDGVYILEYSSGWRKCSPILEKEASVSGLPLEYRSVQTDRGLGVKMITDGTEEQVILDGYAPWIVTDDWIYAAPYIGDRILHTYTAQETQQLEPVLSRTGTVILRFPKNANGSCDPGAGEIVFEEGVSSLDTDEKIWRMEPYGHAVRIVTVRPPTDDSDFPVWRRYVLTRNGVKIDGEGKMYGNSHDTGR